MGGTWPRPKRVAGLGTNDTGAWNAAGTAAWGANGTAAWGAEAGADHGSPEYTLQQVVLAVLRAPAAMTDGAIIRGMGEVIVSMASKRA